MGASACDDHSDRSASQFGCKRRKSIKLILGPAVEDRCIVALDVAGLLQALAKSAQTLRQRIGRPQVEEPDHRHRRLLRARRNRHRCRAASAPRNSRRLMLVPRAQETAS